MSFVTTRLARISSNLKNIKKRISRNSFISSLWTFQGKCFQIGIGVTAMTSVSASLIVSADKGKKDNTDTNKKLEEPDNIVYSLEELVTKRAWYLYKFDKRYKRAFFEKKPNIDLDWSDVEFIPDNPNYKKINVGVDGIRITSQTVFVNESEIEQQHILRAKRQTSSFCTSSLIEGYTIGADVGLSIKAPVDIGFSTAFSLQSAEESTNEEKHSWHVEDCIKVPKESTIKVSMVLKEQEQEYYFTTIITVKGSVRVKYYNQKKEITGIYIIPLSNIIMEEFPERMTLQEIGNECISKITIKGKCKFKHEVDNIVITPKHVHLKTLNDAFVIFQ